MNKEEWIIWIGVALFLEGLLLAVDWGQYGFPSLYVFGFHIHHWMIGLGMVVYGVVKK